MRALFASLLALLAASSAHAGYYERVTWVDRAMHRDEPTRRLEFDSSPVRPAARREAPARVYSYRAPEPTWNDCKHPRRMPVGTICAGRY